MINVEFLKLLKQKTEKGIKKNDATKVVSDKPKKITGKSHVTFNGKGFKSRPEYCNINNRSLNEDIRNSVIKDVFSYVRLFGVQHEHNIRIGKIKACKSVD